MQLKNGCMAVKLMEFVGLCGEVPVSLVRKLPGYYDYNIAAWLQGWYRRGI